MGMSGLSEASRLMTTGGDERLALDAVSGLNKYHSAPRPGGVLAYASSTANDVSAAAQAHVEGVLAALGVGLDAAGYKARLERLRARLRRAYSLPAEVDIVFAPSGTDLEYAALAAAAGRRAAGIHNILLGADEVGSGCVHSAFGRYFAASTALGIATEAGAPVAGFGATPGEMIDGPGRDSPRRARPPAPIPA